MLFDRLENDRAVWSIPKGLRGNSFQWDLSIAPSIIRIHPPMSKFHPFFHSILHSSDNIDSSIPLKFFRVHPRLARHRLRIAFSGIPTNTMQTPTKAVIRASPRIAKSRVGSGAVLAAGGKRGSDAVEVEGDAVETGLQTPPVTPAKRRRNVKAIDAQVPDSPTPVLAPSVPVPIPLSVSLPTLPATHPHAQHAAILHLCKVDPLLAALIARTETPCALLVPPPYSDTFRALVSSIIFQQLAGSAASAILRRFISVFYPEVAKETGDGWTRADPTFPTPKQVLEYSPEQLKQLAGLSASKANYIHGLAEKYASGELSCEMLRGAGEESKVRELLLPVKGIGNWTVDMYVFCSLVFLLSGTC